MGLAEEWHFELVGVFGYSIIWAMVRGYNRQKHRIERNSLASSRSIETKKVEKAAVLAVKNLIQLCPTVDDKLDEDDKNILVDGSLELYRSQEMCIPNFIGKVDVQVKGTTKNPRITKRGFVKFYVKVDNLRRYLDVFHGILFFYVTVNPKQYTARKVYYAQLLPYDINMVLKEIAPNQKSVSVRFRPFPTEPKEITRLLLAFNRDKEVQLKAEMSAYGFFDERAVLPRGIKSFRFSTQLFPGEFITSLSSYREGPYIYGEDESGQLKIIGRMADVSACAIGNTATISSGDFALDTTLLVGESEEGQFLEFEGVRIYLLQGGSRIDYKVAGDAIKRYNTVRFIQEFAKSGTLSVNGIEFLRAQEIALSDEQAKRLKESVRSYGSIVETLEALHISADWDLNELSAREWSNLDALHKLVVEGQPLADREFESPLVHFDIQGSRIYALASKRNDGAYEFRDLFSEDLFFVFGEADELTGSPKYFSDPVGPIASLDEEGYQRIVNLDIDQIEKSFERCPVTPNNQGPLNQKLLEMLSAYDKGCKLPKKLLAVAALLAKKLYEADRSSDTYYLNLMQTQKRARTLEEQEKSRLRDIAIESERYYEKAAAYALLDNQEMADSCLSRCSEEERCQIEGYPIMRFFRRA